MDVIDGAFVLVDRTGARIRIPVGGLACLRVEPGTRVSHAAVVLAARVGCLLVWVGEAGGISEAVHWAGGGGFRFFQLGQPVFLADGGIKPEIRFATLAAWVWYQETRTPWAPEAAGEATPLLGVHEGHAYFLLYNGILGDRRPQGGNVLTGPLLAPLDALAPHAGPRVVYGESCRLSPARLKALGIAFKQIPYGIRAR